MNRPLRIEVITDTYLPEINGVALSLGRLRAGLIERGHRVEVIRPGRARGEGETAVPWWPLPGYWEVRVGAPFPGTFVRRWRKSPPDVVYVAIETPLGFSAASAALKLGIPVVGGFHTNFQEYLQSYGVAWIGRKVWIYQRWFHQRLTRTVVPSPAARSKLVAAGLTKTTVVGRGVDTTLYHPEKHSKSLRRGWGAAEGAPVALVVGRISGEKNIGLAIRAFVRMRELCPEMVCLVVGDGPLRRKLEREYPWVSFPGYLRGEELAACYASADILLFPSETETFGNVLLEGMASGLATVSYDLAAAAWHGIDRVNGLKIKPGDEPAFLEAAVSLLDPELRARLGANARLTAESLGWDRVVADLENVFLEATGGFPRSSP